MAYSINIQPSKQGSLHKLLGVSNKKNIPSKDLAIKRGDNTAVKKKKIFAQNAKKWNHKPSLSKLMGQ